MGQHPLDLASFWVRLSCGLGGGVATWLFACDYGMMLTGRWLAGCAWSTRLAIAAPVGYALLGSGVGVLAACGLERAAVVETLLAIALAARLPRYVRALRRLPALLSRLPGFVSARDAGWQACLLVTLAAFVTACLSAALPAVWWDPIAYHLPLVASALANATMRFDPGMVQSGFPQLAEAAATPAYVLAGSAGAAFATLGCGVVCALQAAVIARSCAPGGRSVGLPAAMLVVSSGLWLWLAPSLYVDVPFAMFLLGAIIAAHEAALADTAVRPRFLLLAGILAGAAAAVKYSGLPAAVTVLGAAWWWSRARWGEHSGRSWVQALVAFAAGACVVAAPWYLRTWLATGDPVYPFATAWLGSADPAHDFARRYADMTRHWCGGGTSLADLAALPYRLLFAPRMFCGDPGVALQVATIAAGVAVIACAWARRIVAWAAALVGLWFFESQQWRFALAPVVSLASLAAAGTVLAGPRLRAPVLAALAILGAYGVVINWLPQTATAAPATLVPAFAYLHGAESAGAYLSQRVETFDAARWLAQRHIPGREILALDDVRDYYFPPGTRWGNDNYQAALTPDWSRSPAQRAAWLQRLGVRYVVVNANPAFVARTPAGIDWQVLAGDTRSIFHRVFAAHGVAIYELGSQS
jgi:hypothetical protein